MPAVVYSNVAKADLREIWDYVSAESQLQAYRLLGGFDPNSNTLPNGTPLAALGQNSRGIAAAIALANTVSFSDPSTMASKSFE